MSETTTDSGERGSLPESLLPGQPEDPNAAKRLTVDLGVIDPNMRVGRLLPVLRKGDSDLIHQSILKYLTLKGVLEKIPQDKRVEILAGLDRYTGQDPGPPPNISAALQLKEPPQQRKKRFLVHDLFKSLFEFTDTAAMNFMLEDSKIDLQELPGLFDDDVFLQIITLLAEEPDKYRFQIGALLSQIPYEKLPRSVQEKLKPALSDIEMELKLGHKNWYLCSMAEARLRLSRESGAVVLVNGKFLVKFIGTMTALCLETFRTKDGKVFIQGNWYSPVDDATRNALKTACDAGKSRIELASGEWAIMRSLGGDGITGQAAKEIIENTLKYVSTMPDTFPVVIDGVSRSQFRKKNENLG